MLRQGEKTGQPIILFRHANYDPALDWTVAFQGTVADFYAADLVSPRWRCTTAARRRDFPDCFAGTNDPAFENEYAPFGVDSGLCMGVAATAFSDEGVTLQPCGVSSKTVWILDTYDQYNFITACGYGIPLINGSDTNFSQPFVLTYPNDCYPTDKPRPQLVVTNLTGFSNGPAGRSSAPSTPTSSGAPTFGVLVESLNHTLSNPGDAGPREGAGATAMYLPYSTICAYLRVPSFVTGESPHGTA